LAFGTSLQLPTGSRDSYSSDGNVRIVPHLLASSEIGLFTAAAKLGFQYRPENTPFAGSPMGHEMIGALSAGLRSRNGKFVIGPELTTSTVVTKGSAVFARRTTPFELLFGSHYTVASDWRIGAGIGPGMSRGLGAPVVRVVGVVEWAPQPKKPAPPPPKDRDKDGIVDDDDACIDEPGIASDDPKKNGCPPPKDRDKDGIVDDDDACIDEPGVASDDPKKNGCPKPKDRDGDKIIDPEDACPDNPGEPNSDPKKNGCPKVIVTETQIQILERVEFETGKARILKESENILTAVLGVLKDNPRISKLSIEGHTDSRADDNFNLGLSRRRAAAVVQWLVEHGIDKNRLTSQGFGETKPLQPNDTEEGRKTNRRVEFHIVEENGTLVDPASSTTTTKSSKTSHE
jgi:outer membrane protein OmpA-like peptidoglycan-associated protein